MLLTSIQDVTPGMKTAAVVLHPRRLELELLSAGTVLDNRMISKLAQLGVTEMWIHHDALADLDNFISPKLTELRRAVYSKIKSDFAQMSCATISTAQVLEYRKTMIQLVFELVGNHKTAGLTDQLFSSDDSLFSHCTNVAYLATLIGLELENYVVTERKRLNVTHARDMSALGLGAMLHDIGKTVPSGVGGNGTLTDQEMGELKNRHEIYWSDMEKEAFREMYRGYEGHPLLGYRLLSDSNSPASARQIVLNHHQRFDGGGWPALAVHGAPRKRMAQGGKGIHIFCRIVSAANVLENLMHEAGGKCRPPVAALHDFMDDRFDGWFDPVIRQAMLRKLPPFAIGTEVILSDGRRGAVVSPSLRQPCRPVVRILEASSGGAGGNKEGVYQTIALEKQPELKIVKNAGVDVEKWLFELPELPGLKSKAG